MFFNQVLQPGSLPDGLAVLAFTTDDSSEMFLRGFQQTLWPGILPASVSVLSMSRHYRQELVAGGIPATVRWLRLPHRPVAYQHDLSAVLSPSTRVVRWNS